MATIKIKRGTTDPTAANVTNSGELAANTSTPKIWLKTADDSTTTPIWVGAQIESSPGDWTSSVKLATQSAINTTFMPKSGGTFTSDISLSGGADIRFIETGGGSDYIAFQAPSSIATSITFTLPSVYGSNGHVLTTDGSGTLSWSAASASAVAVTADNTSSTFYPTFVTGSGSGLTLYADPTTTALSYVPSTSTLTASTFKGNATSSAADTGLTLTGTGSDTSAVITVTGAAAAGAESITLGAATVTATGSLYELPTTYTIQDSATSANSSLTIMGQSTASTFNKTVAIGTTTAAGGTSTVNIATGMNATGIAAVTIGSTTGTSTVTLNGTVVGGATTQNLFNTTATAMYFAGAATTIAVGASTGTATVNNATVTLANATTLNVNGTSPTLASSSTGTLTLFDTNLATVYAFGAAATARLGYSSTGSSTLNVSTGAAGSGNTKAINIGTGSAAGSTTNITIGSTSGTSTVTIQGNLTVSGTTTTVNTATLDVQDKNITVGKGNTTDAGADGAGITADATSPKTFQYDNTNTAWTGSENMNIASSKTYKIAGTTVLSASALGTGVTSSSLTTVGALSSGSITTGFTQITAANMIGLASLDIDGGTAATSVTGSALLITDTGANGTNRYITFNNAFSSSSTVTIDGGTFV